ncbi:replicative DNA helicase [Kitasatospora fiedleri]|uniref:replicative DNA helicase n=1 Tax=Kitasatospora fiedleri TaxID=2991545 RepID=UPI00249CA3D7|nr:replicative DNA helicase [Kitasatospora fiedleri]
MPKPSSDDQYEPADDEFGGDRQAALDARRLAAEEPIIGALLMATASYDVVTEVADELRGESPWLRTAHQLIWEAVIRLHGRRLPTSPQAVAQELDRSGDLAKAGGPSYLHRLAGLAHPAASAAYYAGHLRGIARLATLRQIAERGIHRADTADPEQPEDAIAAHLAEVEQLLGQDVHDDDFGRLGDYLPDELAALEQEDTDPFGVTGFADVDTLMNWRPGEIIVVAARPAMGKSAFALGVATATAATGRPVLFCSLEMGRAEVTKRILAAKSRVAFNHLNRGKSAITDDDWMRIGRHVGSLSALPLWTDYGARTSPGRIRSRARSLAKRTGQAPLIIIDYIGLLAPDRTGRRAENRYAEMTDISRELKLIAKEDQCTIVALAQLNRENEKRQDKKPVPSDLRDSGAIEQDADAILLLHREDYYEKETSRAGETDIIVAKHRNGPTATCTVAHQFHYSRLVDMTRDIDGDFGNRPTTVIHQTGAIGTQTISAADAAALGWTAENSDEETEWSSDSSLGSDLGL